jgi:hypothetical protein
VACAKSRSPEQAKKWHGLADEYLRLALQFEETDVLVTGTTAAVPQTMQQQQARPK